MTKTQKNTNCKGNTRTKNKKIDRNQKIKKTKKDFSIFSWDKLLYSWGAEQRESQPFN